MFCDCNLLYLADGVRYLLNVTCATPMEQYVFGTSYQELIKTTNISCTQ